MARRGRANKENLGQLPCKVPPGTLNEFDGRPPRSEPCYVSEFETEHLAVSYCSYRYDIISPVSAEIT